ncbi:MAG: hypothetical protein V2B18_18600 [Pseudomonadota bacterium]
MGGVMGRLRPAAAVLVATCMVLAGQYAAAIVEDEARALDEGNFYITKRQDYGGQTGQGGFWLADQDNGKIIGCATWDRRSRKYMLFDLAGSYYGFMKATLVDFEEHKLYKQYLWYDRDNNYKGLFVRGLGGRPYLPGVPDEGGRYRAFSQSPEYELGGQLYALQSGNIKIPLPEIEIHLYPSFIEDVVEERD